MDKSNVLYVKSVNKEEGDKQCNYNFCQHFYRVASSFRVCKSAPQFVNLFNHL